MLKRFSKLTVFGGDAALEVGIAHESGWARADGFVVDSAADGVDAAGADAGVAALLREAGPIARTVVIDDALGIDAGSSAVAHLALAVAGARARVARIRFWKWM